MSVKKEVKGFWWAPGRPDVRWFGTLTLEPRRTPKLEVFAEQSGPLEDMHEFGRVVHGKDEHGRPVTLLCVGWSGSSGSGGVARYTLTAGYALLGIALPDAASFCVNDLCLQMQQLYGWLGITGFKRAARCAGDEVVIRYRHPDETLFPISGDLVVGVGIFSSTHDQCQSQGVEEEASIAFRSGAGLSLKGCFDLVHAMRLLLHLASLKPVYPSWMSVHRDGYGHQSGSVWIPEDVEVWTSLLGEAKTETPFPDEWLFRFEDVRGRFPDFMREWLEYVERFAEAFRCYSTTVYHSLPPELDHLCIAQALEAYHGVRFQSQARRGLAGKLKELATPHAGSLTGLVNDVEKFADDAATTRNYYTHHNPDDLAKGTVAKRANLTRLNEKLTLLFQMCVLTDLGIPPDRFSRLRQQLATEIIEYT